MNRSEIKELAKSKIKGNLWNLLWPVLVISAIESILTGIISPAPTIDYTNLESITATTNTSPTAALLVAIISIVCGIAMIAYKKYVLNFVRTGKFETQEILNGIKEKWLNIIICEILVGILVFLASLIFVIPGIILALAYTMSTYLVIDTNLSATDSMKKSREMMKGYKLDYFIFGLSFIGWILLVPFTLFLLLIWLVPYMTVADAIYYDKLKEKTGN